MDLLARYLQAVRFLLPPRQQDDIVRELAENLRSEIDDREEELGRPLAENELADILRRHGHPIVVAGRYRKHQQLIGPALFPMYVFAMKIGLFASLVVTLVVGGIGALLSADPIRHLVDAVLRYPGTALMVFAWTSLVFAALEYASGHLKIAGGWDPRSLPRVVQRERCLSRFNAIAETLALSLVLAWLLLLPGRRYLLLGPAANLLEPAPVWSTAYLGFLLLTAGALAVAGANAARPIWTRTKSLARIGLQVGWVALAGVLLRAGPWVVAKPGATLANGSSPEKVVDVFNASVQIGLAFAVVMALVEIGREVYRWRTRGDAAPADGPAAARVTR